MSRETGVWHLLNCPCVLIGPPRKTILQEQLRINPDTANRPLLRCLYRGRSATGFFQWSLMNHYLRKQKAERDEKILEKILMEKKQHDEEDKKRKINQLQQAIEQIRK